MLKKGQKLAPGGTPLGNTIGEGFEHKKFIFVNQARNYACMQNMSEIPEIGCATLAAILHGLLVDGHLNRINGHIKLYEQGESSLGKLTCS